MSRFIEVKTRIADLWNGIDRNPAHVAAFLSHAETCMRKGPLQIRKVLEGAMGGVGTGVFRTVGVITTCLECGGQQDSRKPSADIIPPSITF